MPSWNKEEHATPGPVIEVLLEWVPNEVPAFIVQKVHGQHGFAPTPEPAVPGTHSLVLLASGRIVLTTSLPDPEIHAPPPQKGEAVGKLPKPKPTALLVTLPWVDNADELRLCAPDWSLLESRSLGTKKAPHPLKTSHDIQRGAD